MALAFFRFTLVTISENKGLSKSYRQGRVALAKIASGSAAAVEASSGNSRSARGVFYEFCIVEFGSSRPWGWKCQGNRKLQKPCFLNVKNRINQIPAVIVALLIYSQSSLPCPADQLFYSDQLFLTNFYPGCAPKSWSMPSHDLPQPRHALPLGRPYCTVPQRPLQALEAPH